MLEEIKIQASIDIEAIKANAATVQEALKFKAEVDIAEIEALSNQTIALTDNINTAFETSADIITNALGQLTSEGLGLQEKWAIQDVLEQESRLRQQEFELQKKLTEATIELTKAKQQKLEAGDAIIKISADGLEPHLELILWEIVQKIQIRANEEQAEYLLGV